MKLKVIKYTSRNGIGEQIIFAIKCLSQLKKNELIHFEFNNFFYTNSFKTNIWDKFFFQPFEEYKHEIHKKIIKKDYQLIQSPEINKLIAKPIISYTHKKSIKKLCDRKYIEPTRKIFKKFIRFKPIITKKTDYFFTKNIKRKKTISVHIRGTDKFLVHAKGQEKLFNYEKFIKPKIINQMKKKKIKKIFLATDEQEKYSKMNIDFKKNLLKYKTSNLSNEAIHWASLFESEKIKNKICEEALIDTVLMSMTDYSFFCQSNLSLVALLLRNDYEYSFIDDHINYR